MNSLFERPFTFDRVVRIVLSVLGIAGGIFLIALLKNALLPFLIAWLLAYMLQPIVKFFQYRLRLTNRVLSISAVLLSIVLIIALIAVLVVPSIAVEAEKTIALIRTYNLRDGNIPFIPQEWVQYLLSYIDISQFTELLDRENLLNALRNIAPTFWSLLSGTFSVLFGVGIIFIVLLYLIFILIDYEKIVNGWIKLIPEKYRIFVSGLAEDVQESMNRYFRGQSLVALSVGILFAIGFRIINFPLGITLGLLLGLLNLIPYLQIVGIIPMIFLSLLRSAETGQSFWIIFGLALLVLAVVQVIQDLILVPKIMGNAMRLNPAIILLSLSIWGTLLGFVGLIIALPLTTLCLSYYRRFILMENSGEEAKKIRRQLKREQISGDQ